MSCADSPMPDCYANSLRPHILLDVDGTPRLPLDLERMIFELAMSRNGVGASAPLLVVAKRVREWTAPLIFRVLSQIRPRRSTDIKHILHSAGHFVQHLMIGSDPSLGPFPNVILSKSCPNLYNLAIHLSWEWNEVESNNPLHVLQDLQKLSRLTLWSFCLSYIEKVIRPACFPNLTHLAILLPSSESLNPSGEVWDVFAQFPKLTHVSVEGDIRSQDVLKLLKDRSSLELVVLSFISIYHHPQSLRVEEQALSHNNVKDNRLLMFERLEFPHVIWDWEKGANGGVDMWRFGELVVFVREKGYFLWSLPDCITRGFWSWERNLNEDGRRWFAGLGLKYSS